MSGVPAVIGWLMREDTRTPLEVFQDTLRLWVVGGAVTLALLALLTILP